jgi:hypothetical protein
MIYLRQASAIVLLAEFKERSGLNRFAPMVNHVGRSDRRVEFDQGGVDVCCAYSHPHMRVFVVALTLLMHVSYYNFKVCLAPF